jgi:hypothetical protein
VETPADLLPLIHEEWSNHTPEWRELPRSGSGEDGILRVFWDPVNDVVRVCGPVVVNNRPHAPAP